MSSTHHEWRPISGQTGRILLTSIWPAPYKSIDSVVFDRRGLAPVTEYLDFRGVRRYAYAGHRVTGTIKPVDSAARAFDRTFPENVFAFSEVDVLVQSVPLQRGESFIAPLFSEVDESVEHDTISVVGPDRADPSARRWIIRFADPAIVSVYEIDSTSRAILSLETKQRRTGARLRYVSVR